MIEANEKRKFSGNDFFFSLQILVPTLITILKNPDENVAETAMGLVKSKLGLMMMQEIAENKKLRDLEKWFIVQLQNNLFCFVYKTHK